MTSENPYESPAGGAARVERRRSRIVGAFVGVAVWFALRGLMWALLLLGLRTSNVFAFSLAETLSVAVLPWPHFGWRYIWGNNGASPPWLDDTWLSILVSLVLWGSAGAWLWGRRRGAKRAD